jgi:hypothetical protein
MAGRTYAARGTGMPSVFVAEAELADKRHSRQTSHCGTIRTSRDVRALSAYGAEADMPNRRADFRC